MKKKVGNNLTAYRGNTVEDKWLYKVHFKEVQRRLSSKPYFSLKVSNAGGGRMAKKRIRFVVLL